ncbi:MAG: chemotaxis protein CheW [Bacteriovorax sp.]|nr:chemotaxis protein CheW [Bacteriovorax sp.]
MENEDFQDKRKNDNLVSSRFLVFKLLDKEYGIPLLQVREVMALRETTFIPQSALYFKGILNIRGEIVAIMDLRLKLKLASSLQSNESSIVILDFSHFSIGVIVDSIDSVIGFNQDEINPAPNVEQKIETNFILGIANKDKRIILLLNMGKIFNCEDAITLDQKAS